jgi:hypothetical protein
MPLVGAAPTQCLAMLPQEHKLRTVQVRETATDTLVTAIAILSSDRLLVSAGAGWCGRRQREVLSDGDFDDAGTVHRQCLHDGVSDLVRA